jgi:hypothetical protein
MYMMISICNNGHKVIFTVESIRYSSPERLQQCKFCGEPVIFCKADNPRGCKTCPLRFICLTQRGEDY